MISEFAWHSLFARNLFITPMSEDLTDHEPEFTIVQVPGFKARPETDGTNSETVVLLDFARRLVLIGGTAYAGECKKSVFTIMNFLMPARNVLPMHCSVSVGGDGTPAVFFGLSGHRQDHALGRPPPGSARRRRARLERGRPLQLRGRLLRQGDPARPRQSPQIYATTRRCSAPCSRTW